VIPREATRHFDIKPADSLLVLGDEKPGGLAIMNADLMKELFGAMFGDTTPEMDLVVWLRGPTTGSKSVALTLAHSEGARRAG
jgi:hypothetical protein